MGVTSLWQILQPCARPIKLETLNRKRLAVDASIWIYQFLKAVRDKEGNALRNSHVVGFFRRICKLLFFGIKPVFVFDGGAPALKRQVIRARKQRREGRREDAVRTAGKLLAVQMQRLAEEEEQKRKDERDGRDGQQQEEEVPDEGLVYVDELQMNQQERQQSRKFRKTDAYHLPELDSNFQAMGQPNDPRIMSLEDLEAYARQFDTGEDINVYDFSKIDYDGSFFMSLPASDRYNILNAARLRSRLRMGHSKEQLDSMFPDRMAFSKFQIERVRERNELTQRLMHLNGPEEDSAFGFDGSARVAGEKGREYVLVKNDGVEGGWALGVIGGDEGRQDKPIDIDRPPTPAKAEEEEEENEFEDVPIEGLNRLPKIRKTHGEDGEAMVRQRQAFYKRRRQGAKKRTTKVPQTEDENALFVAEEPAESEDEVQQSDEGARDDDLFGEDEDEDLNRAIAMSLQKDAASSPGEEQGVEDDDDEMREVFQQSAVEAAKSIPKGSGRAIASIVNQRALKDAPNRHEKFSFGVPVPISRDLTQAEDTVALSKPTPEASSSESEDDAMDFQKALAESRQRKQSRPEPPAPSRPSLPQQVSPAKTQAQTDVAKNHGFSGPLPFESLDLGSSILGKKKMQKATEQQSGGFIDSSKSAREQKKAEPLPPWFSGDLEEDLAKQRAIENRDRERAREFNKQFRFDEVGGRALKRQETKEVIDLEAEDEPTHDLENGDVIDLDSEEDQAGVSLPKQNDVPVFDPKLRMGDIANNVRADPPTPEREPQQRKATPPRNTGPFEDDESEPGDARPTTTRNIGETLSIPTEDVQETMTASKANQDEEIAWSESDDEKEKPSNSVRPGHDMQTPDQAVRQLPKEVQPTGGAMDGELSRSPSMEFEEVGIPDEPQPPTVTSHAELGLFDDDSMEGPPPADGLARENIIEEDQAFDDFSDPEDEELLISLEREAQEHARFASELNNKTHAQNVMDYERELKQLRNQQKKDRRDADEVTHIMISECQQLLRLFGLPYVTAPMEAEAQCAELVRLELVDGIVTDDSDCFLFGGTRVYKNMFNQAKFVECYLTSDLEKEFDLTRQKLIAVAHLLGSDYTDGLPGVGPVTALEILSEFGDLTEFKNWWTGVQMNTVPKSEDAAKPFRKKFRKNATKLFLPPTFPDARVEGAYMKPEVDGDPEQFQWGVPDLDALRSFLMATIGWSQERTDEVLVPVIRDMNRRTDEGTQANITAFFEGAVGIGAAGKGGEGFAPRKRGEGSRRMGNALNKMAAKAKLSKDNTGPRSHGLDEDEDEDSANGHGVARSAAVPAKRSRGNVAEAQAEENSDEGSEFEAPQRKGRKKRAKASTRGRGRKSTVPVDE